ncbi:hypothetical protein IF2G_01632 [Cordyceps javanica]|nr:hypothetical protein IF2G_01632 [Cordyceps javanica]
MLQELKQYSTSASSGADQNIAAMTHGQCCSNLYCIRQRAACNHCGFALRSTRLATELANKYCLVDALAFTRMLSENGAGYPCTSVELPEEKYPGDAM